MYKSYTGIISIQFTLLECPGLAMGTIIKISFIFFAPLIISIGFVMGIRPDPLEFATGLV